MEEQYKKLLNAALSDLDRAQGQMNKDTVPRTPIPRPRIFQITPRVRWPYIRSDGGVQWSLCMSRKYPLHLQKTLDNILNDCHYQPRAFLRALRRIQAATEWCRARTDGRRRMAEEILRQQAKAVESLEAEAVMAALK